MLATVRRGNYTMGDFGKVGWSVLNWEAQYRISAEMFSLYPIKFTKYLAYNTGYIANVAWSALQKIYPTALMSVLQMGCRVPLVEDQEVAPTLAEQYLHPSLEFANRNLLLRARDLLALRAKNEKLFRL